MAENLQVVHQREEVNITPTYHCRNDCTERIPAEKAHNAILNYFDQVAVRPEVEKLYLEVMEDVFKMNETNRGQEKRRHHENLVIAEKKLASLEEKYVLNEIERDSYNFMKPRFKDEINKIKSMVSDLAESESNHSRYLRSGVNLLQNLKFYYENASLKISRN